jgi:hypothetical protein
LSRDYQSLAKVTKKFLAPLVIENGFTLANNMFSRESSSWNECFMLQASSYANPHFWANVGLHLPRLEEFYGAVSLIKVDGEWLKISNVIPGHGQTDRRVSSGIEDALRLGCRGLDD